MQQNVRIKISCQNSAFNLHLFSEICIYVNSFYHCMSKLSRIAENWVKDAITLSVEKKKTHAEFGRYEESALYKFFLYKFFTKCTDLI